MKLFTKLFAAALLLCAVTVHAAKVLTNWSPTMGYNKSDAAAWQDDGKNRYVEGDPQRKMDDLPDLPDNPCKGGSDPSGHIEKCETQRECKTRILCLCQRLRLLRPGGC